MTNNSRRAARKRRKRPMTTQRALQPTELHKRTARDSARPERRQPKQSLLPLPRLRARPISTTTAAAAGRESGLGSSWGRRRRGTRRPLGTGPLPLRCNVPRAWPGWIRQGRTCLGHSPLLTPWTRGKPAPSPMPKTGSPPQGPPSMTTASGAGPATSARGPAPAGRAPTRTSRACGRPPNGAVASWSRLGGRGRVTGRMHLAMTSCTP
mmetsp:Transcript_7166/g.17190  ORF Transcript_7166/g.17190 Transcript_7166/m.17190 type:complete len:209 (+) Transcript_7166:1090-1716(+)